MNPTNDRPDRQAESHVPEQRRIVTPPRDQASSRNAAADVIRGQLNAIYSSRDERNPRPISVDRDRRSPGSFVDENTTADSAQPQPTPQSDSHLLHTAPPTQHTSGTQTAPPAQSATPASVVNTKLSDDQWNQYHSAWQKYYQMYYDRYYANHLEVKDQEISRLTEEQKRLEAEAKAAKEQNGASPAIISKLPVSDSQAAAIKELRSQIQQKVRASATKARKSRHFIPVLSGVCVLLIFLFLQYNRILFGAVAAYTTPGSIDPQNIIVDTSTDVAVGPESKMIIPKLNVDAPVVYGAAADHKSQMKAMERGIAHFAISGASAVPGQVGNAVFAAHSSNDAFAAGDYKFVFAQNEKLIKGDIIYMNYNSKRYTYKVSKLEVVMPTEVSKVQQPTNKPTIILVSCVPLGTAEKRLLVFAEQISPDPDSASQSAQTSSSGSNIPGKPSPSVIERAFGAQ